MTKAEAGRLGGQKTVQKYGRKHMAQIGAKGADATWTKYSMKPAGTRGWAMVDKVTGIIVAVIDF